MTEDLFRKIIREELQAILGICPAPSVIQSADKSPAAVAIAMAKAGDIEGSKAFLKSLSSRKKAA